ncbi:MAG TPA: RdgB/HAM1 family non-canonical purine NTP pyrophosphatase [Chitinophagaceae bacterium]|nr:RdgB/HAM1 family non-canonical purine NTP pyrophosphatase [Chitinophagaceae bacterium]
MDTLIFATNNQHKIDEIRSIPEIKFHIIGLKEAGIDIDIPEPYDTLEENATEKSTVIYKLTGLDCFSEDTGLEVEALNGVPGVKSARYAGNGKSFEKNIDKLLLKMKGKETRNAQFRTILSLILKGNEYKFEGICKGNILADSIGKKGFGYDPVFLPLESQRTFAEMDMEEKNKFSHRKKATDKMIDFLQNISKQ